jgi:hypothetical protein
MSDIDKLPVREFEIDSHKFYRREDKDIVQYRFFADTVSGHVMLMQKGTSLGSEMRLLKQEMKSVFGIELGETKYDKRDINGFLDSLVKKTRDGEQE